MAISAGIVLSSHGRKQIRRKYYGMPQDCNIIKEKKEYIFNHLIIERSRND
jgi:hypothetical protein